MLGNGLGDERDSSRARALFEHSLEAMIVGRADGRILAANPAACAMFGYSAPEIVAGGTALLIDPLENRFEALMAATVRAGRCRGMLNFKRRDGGFFDGEVAASVFRGGDDEPLTTLCVRDVSELKRVLEVLDARTIELRHAEELARLKDGFLSTMSHEMKTPLTLIAGYLELFEERYPNEPLVDGMRDGTRRLVDHVTRILDYSALLSGRVTLFRTLTEPREVLDMAANRVESAVLAKGQRIDPWVADDTQPLDVDVRWIVAALSELLDNARKFCPAGAHISLEAAAQQGLVTITVRDAGPGIPVGQRGRVLEPFTQLELADTRRQGGLGLGLAIAQLVAEHHGGRLVLDGDGGGTCARLELPVEA
jgi:PAS domain S-box-containing protein